MYTIIVSLPAADTHTAITMSDATATAPLAETSNAPVPDVVVTKKSKTSPTKSPTAVEKVPAPMSEEPAAEAVEPKPMNTVRRVASPRRPPPDPPAPRARSRHRSKSRNTEARRRRIFF